MRRKKRTEFYLLHEKKERCVVTIVANAFEMVNKVTIYLRYFSLFILQSCWSWPSEIKEVAFFVLSRHQALTHTAIFCYTVAS